VSPLDGRYHSSTLPLSEYVSELAFFKYRIKIEILFLEALSEYKVVRALTAAERTFLARVWQLTDADMVRLKELERQTNHDVKAIEYFIREQLEKTSLANLTTYVHFGLTSEDVNNLAYRCMVQGAVSNVLMPAIVAVLQELLDLSERYLKLPMLARTHGQPAIPTTLGKEMLVFATRMEKKISALQQHQLTGKLNGAVGGYHALVTTYPHINWPKLSHSLITKLGFRPTELSTQINPPDDLVELFSVLHQLNSILLDLNQDIWRYISDDWLVQKGKETEVGSSTMPHKTNPIEFENSEGNLGIANALFEGFNRKLPISRLQRDLSDSTVYRNIGVAFGHSLLAYQSLRKGLSKLAAHEDVITSALNKNYAILLEAWQVWARTTNDQQAYEKAMRLGKSKLLTAQDWQELTVGAPASLQKLTPATYLGLSSQLAQRQLQRLRKQQTLFLKTVHTNHKESPS
jgi:adenylosuccinate lyase